MWAYPEQDPVGGSKGHHVESQRGRESESGTDRDRTSLGVVGN